ncbi:MAG: selenocysteine-specific translation factor, partial [Chloroflexaceae bacterium]|nr:selenocysteine-specific translation factor [Chloroflexaceae bacterium]
ALGTAPPQPWPDLVQQSGLPDDLAHEGLATLQGQGRVLVLAAVSAEWVVSAEGWHLLEERLTSTLHDYHRRYPLRAGIAREELRQRLGLDERTLPIVLAEASRRALIDVVASTVWVRGYTPAPTPAQQQALADLLAAIRQQPYSPPMPDLDAELLAWVVEQGRLVRLSDEIFFLAETYEELLAWVRATIASEGGLRVARFRDQFGTTRKYALTFLEHLDAQKITRRTGDVRVLR